MPFSVIYALLAILGLGFLVFIHELGHYWVARRQGMKVEAFAIGFGKPIYTWMRQGVEWRICMLPFGGYVKIAGMQKEGNREPFEIPDGFYGKKPWQRIQVALAGPLVNIAFAFLAFAVLWMAGGRNKESYEFTHRIGWVDPNSALYEKGVRPGDIIQKYDGKEFKGFKDLLVASMMSGETAEIQGFKVDYLTGKRSGFDYTLRTYENQGFSKKEKFHTIGVLSPASYLIFDGSLPAGSPMAESGILPRDRILWADGEMVFSQQQLSSLINESTAFLTVQRGDRVFQTKVPRVHVDEFKLSGPEKGEIDDWQHEAGLKGRLQDLYFIPYNLSPTADVEGRLQFIDEQDGVKAFAPCQRCASHALLEEGDKILAVDGVTVRSSYELLERLQNRQILLIVERDPAAFKKIRWTEADRQFDQFNRDNLETILSSIGTAQPVADAGTLHLLQPVTPKPFSELSLPNAQKTQLTKELAKAKKEIESIQDSERRADALNQFEQAQKRAVLGLPLKDRTVVYNPTPQEQFGEVFHDTWRTLAGLVSGDAHPKYMAGPVGIVQIVHQSWMIGFKEALFWMALISLNLGLINLLPLPVLDGGHIAFSLVEIVTKRPLRARTMERLVIPFVGLLIVFFIYITYNDLSRLLGKLF
jgi:regulator of sigma E protease